MSFRLVSKSVTLNDLERRNGRYFALFRRIRLRMPAKTPLAGDKIGAPAACAVPFRPYCGGVITRARNVSEYMLVLALSPPPFGPCLLWPNGRQSQQLLSSLWPPYVGDTDTALWFLSSFGSMVDIQSSTAEIR